MTFSLMRLDASFERLNTTTPLGVVSAFIIWGDPDVGSFILASQTKKPIPKDLQKKIKSEKCSLELESRVTNVKMKD